MRLLIAVAGIVILTAGSVFAGPIDVGTFGALYPIAEPDLLEELRSRAASTDWKKYLNPDRMEENVKKYRPEGTAILPLAEKSQVRRTRYVYMLDFDVPDNFGHVLYPKGYSFNPISYLHLWLPKIVVIDANDKRQVEWFEKSGMNSDDKVTLLITGGDFYDLAKHLKRPVFYLSELVTEKLDIRAVPSVVTYACNYCKPTQSTANSPSENPGDWVLEIEEFEVK
jgi:conjugal transfer pilus assembly protein TraW